MWEVYGEVLDTAKNIMIIDWGLPKTYSEKEKTEIENSISIRAFKTKDFKSIEDIIGYEYLRINPTECALEVENNPFNARTIYCTTAGWNYKGKIYFQFKNSIAYIITYMATPGTYDINLPLFEEFYKSFEPL